LDDVIIYVCGNRYQIFNLTTHECHTYAGQDTDGVGSIAVHPNRKFFAVAEKGKSPNIYIREYPSMRLYRILRKGTEMLYAHTEFSQSGEKLVSLGGSPDYTITVWNWINQKVILKCKAWGQEVFRASFSPYSENVLTTAGQGHIKFWKMATTFTGLKLQGEGGKFGGLDRSDTSAYYELPDGKFVSGTEAGNLILWEGVLVKAHLVLDRDTKAPLHKGMIEVVLYEDKNFITAGADGFIKWWPLADIDQAEGDEAPEVAIRPLKEVSISTPEGDYAHIVNMVKGKGMWLVQDAKGRLWQLDAKDYQATVVREFHQGAITDLAVSDSFNMCITTGENGLVKVWDYLR
jgi:WD40 repeat protein